MSCERFHGMKRGAGMQRTALCVLFFSLSSLACTPDREGPVGQPTTSATDPLPSWNDGAAKEAIVAFVTAVATPGSPSFVSGSERIATFDNDGTLWVEKPIYTGVVFALDKIRDLLPEHPEWRTTEPFQSLLEGDMEGIAAAGKDGLVQLYLAGHTGMTTQDFALLAREWADTARHARFQRLYTDLTYQPMVELVGYLQENGFKTYIVSGGGIEFMRTWTEEAYGIPPEQVIGTSVKTRFELRSGVPVLVREPDFFFVDDKEGKAVAIQKFIGRRPIAAFGNSDADIPMLQWALAGEGKRLAMLVHHTDAAREYAYDRDSHIGRLDRGLDEAGSGGWLIIDTKADWRVFFPPR